MLFAVRESTDGVEDTGRFAFYFEPGQGADFTNGHAHGYDILLHESRKYGFIRALTKETTATRRLVNEPAA